MWTWMRLRLCARVGMPLCMVVFLSLSLSLSLFPAAFFVHVDASSVVAITSPKTLTPQQWTTDANQITPAVFGSPKYGGYVNGILFYPTDPDNRLACYPINTKLEKDLPTGEGLSVIWMVDRSPPADDPATPLNDVCSFVTKVRNAQAAGAVAVVVVNRVDEDGKDEPLVYMADDGTGRNVLTPAVMIQKSATVGPKGIIEKMRIQQGTTPPTTEPTEPTTPPKIKFVRIGMQISWSIPTADGNVAWDLWTSAWDTQSVSLKRLFGPADLAIHEHTSFTPRYYYYDGTDFDGQDCTDTTAPCGDLCAAGGKYCQFDPDGPGADTITGEDIVIENLWQSCVWDTIEKAATAGGKEAHKIRNKWWGYVSAYQKECNSAELWRAGTCRNQTMDKYDIDKHSVATCRAGCTLSPGATCTKIKQDIRDRITNGVFYLPTMVVNQEAIRGDISCNPPISISTCNVFNDICQGYSSSTRPPVCTDSADGCNFWEQRDCAGVCGGSSSVDRCGLCLSASDGSRDKACLDCAKVINGNHTIDGCGICLEPNDPTRNTTCHPIDCKGIVGGTAVKDQCGICEGDGKSCQTTTSWGAIIAITIAIAGIVGGVIYLYMRRQQNRMRDDIDGILKQYLPLDGNSGGGAGLLGGGGHIRPTQRLDGNDNL